jgi:hypothetical protein
MDTGMKHLSQALPGDLARVSLARFSGEGFGGARFGAAALPFVVFAQPALVLLQLRFDLAEGFFARGAEVLVAGGGMHGTSGQRESQSQCVFQGAGDFGEYGVQRNQIGFIALQKRVEFCDRSVKLLVDGIVTLDIFETDGEFHMRTCRICEG